MFLALHSASRRDDLRLPQTRESPLASKPDVFGKGLLKRVSLLVAVAAILLAARIAQATPIHPDIRKLVSQPREGTTAFSMPARAGWDGPETPLNPQPGESPLNPERLARAERAELLAAATPDPRAVLGIVAVIFLLRLLRRTNHQDAGMRVVPVTEDKPDQIAA